MRSTIIHDLPAWRVTSYGNGLAYEIAEKASGKTLYFQGDNAAQFRDEFDGNLIDCDVPQHDDGDAAHALMEDCRAWLFDDVQPGWIP